MFHDFFFTSLFLSMYNLQRFPYTGIEMYFKKAVKIGHAGDLSRFNKTGG